MTLYNYYENRGAIIKEALSKSFGLLWEGLPAEVAAWREKGGSSLGAYRVLAEHLLSFAMTRPLLCRFILTEDADGDWIARNEQIEKMCGLDSFGGAEDPADIRRDAYLFELLAFAVALKVIGGGETPERFGELVGEAYRLLLERHEPGVQSST
jgi:hypothetical protein